MNQTSAAVKMESIQTGMNNFPLVNRSARALLYSVACFFVSLPAQAKVDFNRDIRPIVSNTCFLCHGPDQSSRKAKLRLDVRDEAIARGAIVPGKPDESEAYKRVASTDPNEIMPPPELHKALTKGQIETFRQWILEGAEYKKHWSYERPQRPQIPKVKNTKWANNAIDNFILARLEKEGLTPQPEAEKTALIRRVSLDLTGLPPTIEDADNFLSDKAPNAYEKVVDRLLASPAYGEHQARQWLDLARYADSAGYADDPLRTIWPYRDYVIKSFNDNKPFDQFTVEQIAGDLLPNPTEEQLVATAFHRNTMTNSEGGTDDEEFRNAAIVDRVNTTMSVWMGTSMACAQCHTHKYDPITQKEYFQVFAFFNQSEDADRKDESPLLSLCSDESKKQKTNWENEIAANEKQLSEPSPAVVAAYGKWARDFPSDIEWQPLLPEKATSSSGAEINIEQGVMTRPAIPVVAIEKEDDKDKKSRQPITESYTVETPLPVGKLSALRLEVLPEPQQEGTVGSFTLLTDGPSSITRLSAELILPDAAPMPKARYVRLELPGDNKLLQIAEVQVFSNGENIALRGEAKQSSTYADAEAKRAIDGNTAGEYAKGSVSHTGDGDKNPWWEVDLKGEFFINNIVIWNRAELPERMKGFRLLALNEKHQIVWEKANNDAPTENATFSPTGAKPLHFSENVSNNNNTFYTTLQDGNLVLTQNTNQKARPSVPTGWPFNGSYVPKESRKGTRWFALALDKPLEIPANARLRLFIEHQREARRVLSNGDSLKRVETVPLNRFRLLSSASPRTMEYFATPQPVKEALALPDPQRDSAFLLNYYARNVSPELKPVRERIAALQKQIAEQKPVTVPVMHDLPPDKARKTRLQLRGSYLALDEEVGPAVPAAWSPLPKEAAPNRLALARWIVADDNPLTARVVANRYWENLFGIGLVRTVEEFGSQGEMPTHPELLDYLATELVAQKWDIKKFLKLLVMSKSYRQSSKVTPQLIEKDPENILISRGPRFRMSAEMVRDQALELSGILSHKMYGPPVRPTRPNSGLSAAFGGGLDWKTSDGEDSHRRALYTEWRRTSPYPSLTTFDAPNREICTLRRTRTNTPLQALVTLNDPVYIEAAQALARRITAQKGTASDKLKFAFRLCLSRLPNEKENARLLRLHDETLTTYKADEKAALSMATEPLGPAPPGADIADLAAWTTVSNVLLNLDETLMKR